MYCLEQSLQPQQETAYRYQSQAKELEKQVDILTEKHQQLVVALRQSEDKIETLRDEKLFLIQEKSELTGSLKQLQRGVLV